MSYLHFEGDRANIPVPIGSTDEVWKLRKLQYIYIDVSSYNLHVYLSYHVNFLCLSDSVHLFQLLLLVKETVDNLVPIVLRNRMIGGTTTATQRGTEDHRVVQIRLRLDAIQVGSAETDRFIRNT